MSFSTVYFFPCMAMVWPAFISKPGFAACARGLVGLPPPDASAVALATAVAPAMVPVIVEAAVLVAAAVAVFVAVAVFAAVAVAVAVFVAAAVAVAVVVRVPLSATAVRVVDMVSLIIPC